MKKTLLLIAILSSNCFAQSPPNNDILSLVRAEFEYPAITPAQLDELKQTLRTQAPTLNEAVINKVLTSLKCTNEYNIENNNKLTIIDYSLPSSEKRLWVFDLKEKQLLFHTYVSHGIKSGVLLSNHFSNTYNSKASSIGVYKTEKIYHGRHGLSLSLAGMDRGFNDNAANRAVVMHGGWYVSERFIKKYGRAGRSWGCPAVPTAFRDPIINTIRDNALFVIYYPSDDWFSKSKFLNCDKFSLQQHHSEIKPEPPSLVQESDLRDDVLYVDLNKNNKHEENEPIVAITADGYEKIFQTKAPVDRMLRRQINHLEYIALTNAEFITMSTNNEGAYKDENLYMITPEVKMVRGYYATEMKIKSASKIKEFNTSLLKSTKQFIRWLGL